MASFVERMKHSASLHNTRIVLALDLPPDGHRSLLKRALYLLEEVSEYLAAVKLNHHLLLPLDLHGSVRRLVAKAHSLDLQVIADLKLSDIGSTNLIASRHLWKAGFDAVIASPLVGFEEGLGPMIAEAHKRVKGVITLAYMSQKGAKEFFDLAVDEAGAGTRHKMYELFLDRASAWSVDGVIVAASRVDVIRLAKKVLKEGLVFCPGIGVKADLAKKALAAGGDFIIVGRSIVESRSPSTTTSLLRSNLGSKGS